MLACFVDSWNLYVHKESDFRRIREQAKENTGDLFNSQVHTDQIIMVYMYMNRKSGNFRNLCFKCLCKYMYM